MVGGWDCRSGPSLDFVDGRLKHSVSNSQVPWESFVSASYGINLVTVSYKVNLAVKDADFPDCRLVSSTWSSQSSASFDKQGGPSPRPVSYLPTGSSYDHLESRVISFICPALSSFITRGRPLSVHKNRSSAHSQSNTRGIIVGNSQLRRQSSVPVKGFAHQTLRGPWPPRVHHIPGTALPGRQCSAPLQRYRRPASSARTDLKPPLLVLAAHPSWNVPPERDTTVTPTNRATSRAAIAPLAIGLPSSDDIGNCALVGGWQTRFWGRPELIAP
ncbi:hypothetical protein ACJZ2D_012707 [Fusarium nematophilum]